MSSDAAPAKDPIVHGSLSWHIMVATGLLALSVVWAIYDEMWGRRPYKAIQKDFANRYRAYIAALRDDSAARDALARQDSKYVEIMDHAHAAARKAGPEVEALKQEIAEKVQPYLKELAEPLKVWRSEVAAKSYLIDVAPPDRQAQLHQDLALFKNTSRLIRDWPDGETWFTYDELLAKFDHYNAEFGRLQREEIVANMQAADLEKQARQRFDLVMVGLAPARLDGLLADPEVFGKVGDIRQIYVQEKDGVRVDFVDRCESCHVGARQPLPIVSEHQAFEGSPYRRVFRSHPAAVEELLRVHDPEVFGCATCHDGNGISVTSTLLAHGWNHHWLHPLYFSENFEAGCVKCHTEDLVLPGATVLNEGKELFRFRGCWGCHRMAGFDPEPDQIFLARKDLEGARGDVAKIDVAIQRAVDALPAEKNTLTQTRTLALSRQSAREKRVVDLMADRKRVGPSLKEARVKLKPEWIPAWLADVRGFRPTSKMPQLRLNPDQARAISVFVWTSAMRAVDAAGRETGNGLLDPADPRWARPAPDQEKEWARQGELSLELRGCLGCHSIEKSDGTRIGGGFAADLSRVGEKVNYEYLVRWIHDPRERTRPYSPFWVNTLTGHAGRDLGPGDFKNLDGWRAASVDGARDPETGDLLLTHQMTVMPSLRLSWGECARIAWFLTTRRRADAAYEPVDGWIEREEEPVADENRAAQLRARGMTVETRDGKDFWRVRADGERWTRHFGCGGCHEIAGFEEEKGIGTELTTEGSKPLERLDFGVIGHDAHHGAVTPGLWEWVNEHYQGRWGEKPPSVREHERQTGESPAPEEGAGPEVPDEQWSRPVVAVINDPQATFGQLWEARLREAADKAEPEVWREARMNWYRAKGFFEHKLRTPNIWDYRKNFTRKPDELLRMPDFGLSERQINALTTFILGNVDTEQYPRSYFYRPTGLREAVQEGWWVIKKYNCAGCHMLEPGQAAPALWNTPVFDDDTGNNTDYEDYSMNDADFGKAVRPPTLVGEGARVEGGWLRRFLMNPSLAHSGSETENDRNGVRFYLQARMPTFFLSDNEIGKLERFFAAMAGVPGSETRAPLPPLDDAELSLARQIVTARGCATADCHGKGAPDFGMTHERLRPAWVERWIWAPKQFDPDTKMLADLFFTMEEKDGAPLVTRGDGQEVESPDTWAWLRRQIGPDFRGRFVNEPDEKKWTPAMRAHRGDHLSLITRYLDHIGVAGLKDEVAALRRLAGAAGETK
ncbi:MAG: c-type cytochrome [Planctomycetes bacterium]|nr:c-type cytochrome [Planctomycetota bacterium]